MRGPAVALAGVLALGACSFTTTGSDEPAASPPTEAAETADRVLPLVADVVRNPGGSATVSGASLLIPGYPGSALVAFDAGGVVPDCLERAHLSVEHLGGDPIPEAWVSLETELASVTEGSSLGQQVIAPSSPSSRPVLADRRYRWDVTELLRWSRQRQASDSTFVVVLKPISDGMVELGASESGAGAELTIEEQAACA